MPIDGARKLSEKSLELNVGAELLMMLRNEWGMPKAYLRGLTQSEENQEGADFFAQLDPETRIFAFQFKRPKGDADELPYRFTLSKEQHRSLHQLAGQASPGSVSYVFPFYVTPTKLQQDLPSLAEDTWLLDVQPLATDELFGGFDTRTIACERGIARVNPEYKIRSLRSVARRPLEGIAGKAFADWYKRQRHYGREARKQRNPWLVRGLRVAIVVPENGDQEGSASHS